MAKSKESFTKKEKEKKRLKQQQDKREKMEARKATRKNDGSLDGMLAYLDENGNLTDTPPDPKRKKIFSQEDIQIGVPAREKEIETFRTGTVSFFNKAKGFGFINDQESRERVFFFINDIAGPLEEADKVKFLVERGPRGLSAKQVSKL